MAENLLAKEMLSKGEINDFIKSDIQPLLSRNEGAYIDRMKRTLQQLYNKSLQLEKQAYSLFMVKNIQELQTKLDRVNESGLIFLSNRVLSKLPAIRETKDATISRDEVLEAVDSTFMNYLKTNKGIEDIELLTEKEINKMFNEMATSMGKSRRYKFITKTNINGTSKLMYNMSSAVKRDLAKEYGITVKTHYGEDNITLQYDLDGKVVSAKLQSYPYFALTPEQQKDAMNNTTLWNNFKLAIKSCVHDSELQQAIESSMIRMGREAFISTGGSYQDIVGILGELQGMTILRYLTKYNSKNEFLGHVLDKEGKKIGIDLALEGIGFQIKNYSTVQTSSGDEVLNLGKDYTLKGFLNVVEKALENSEARTSLEMFYAISAYHISADKDFKETRQTLDKIQKDELPQLYHGAVADLLPLKSLNLLDGRNMQNVFYLIGGTKILPVSAILSRFIDFLDNLDDRKKILTTRVIYEGITYKDFFKRGVAFPGYTSIVNQIGMHYNVRLGINSTIQEALQIR